MKKKAFTLIEAVITITILAVAGTFITVFIVKGLEIWSFYRDSNTARFRAQSAMRKVVKELRRIPSKDDVLKITSKEIRFEVPGESGGMNEIGFVAQENGRLYFFDKEALTLGGYHSSYIEENKYRDPPNFDYDVLKFEVARINYADFSFRYYGANPDNFATQETDSLSVFQESNPAVFPGPERIIKVTIPAVGGDGVFTLSTLVRLRNGVF